jgi:hypothetical protein
MTETALDHPLVRGYLATLDEALRRLPVAQARELREQLTAHLNEVLPPGASDAEVRSILSQLGRPADLVDEAVAGTGAVSPTAALKDLGFAVRLRLAQVRRRTWIAAAVLVVLAAAAAVRTAHFLGAGPLEPGAGLTTWWYAQDLSHQKNDELADGTSQTMVPVRFGQRQGYVVALYNRSDVAQTVTGASTGTDVAPDNPGGARNTQIAVSASDPNLSSGPPQSFRYTLPGVLPPHQIRLVRVLWTTAVCLDPHSSMGIDHVSLQVRVGWFTRTEAIPLDPQFFLGGPSAVPCSNFPEPHRT